MAQKMNVPALVSKREELVIEEEGNYEWSDLEREFIPRGSMPRCVSCNMELGLQNPRQYCKKTMCPNEKQRQRKIKTTTENKKVRRSNPTPKYGSVR